MVSLFSDIGTISEVDGIVRVLIKEYSEILYYSNRL